ncbi:hypothetical protein niasHT_037317 [Heterodera trifolii]|uniref:Uncharacterized protein n=1 Tax=Heterodera trifolii TaxID=157864 RepID=A0ABD2J216_9BILA
MELLLFRHDEFDKLYGCDGFNADKIPLEERTNIVNGCILITLFFVFELALFMCALETGILGIIGAVYCDYPMLIYTTGSIGLSLWFAETAAEFLLAINRCLELLKPELAYVIFNGNKTWWLCAVPIFYALGMAMFTKPILFSGLNLAWFFNPYIGYTDDFEKIYHNTLHTVHDCFVIFGLSAIYIVFSAILSWKNYKMSANQQTNPPSWTQKKTFLQVVIISFFNAISSGIYLSMQFVKISDIYIIIGTYTWIFAHGCPPVVYLLLNKRIRDDCANFCRDIFRFLLSNVNNNSVSNGPIAMAWMTPNYAGSNANNRTRDNKNLTQQ